MERISAGEWDPPIITAQGKNVLFASQLEKREGKARGKGSGNCAQSELAREDDLGKKKC